LKKCLEKVDQNEISGIEFEALLKTKVKIAEAVKAEKEVLKSGLEIKVRYII
jgi:hypothetical protein